MVDDVDVSEESENDMSDKKFCLSILGNGICIIWIRVKILFLALSLFSLEVLSRFRIKNFIGWSISQFFVFYSYLKCLDSLQSWSLVTENKFILSNLYFSKGIVYIEGNPVKTFLYFQTINFFIYICYLYFWSILNLIDIKIKQCCNKYY